MSKITRVIARQVYDSRGNPTIEAEVFANNMKARAICPSGASTGSHEAYEKRDLSNKRYLGKSVLKPVELINKIISKKLKNQNIHNQEKIDSILIKLDGTKQKKKFGANALLAVSMATKKLSARIKKTPLYKTFLINWFGVCCSANDHSRTKTLVFCVLPIKINLSAVCLLAN